MESLKISISLRSLDADGRSLGPERSPGTSGNPARTAFAEDLEAAARPEPRDAEAPRSTEAAAAEPTDKVIPSDPDGGVLPTPTEPDTPTVSATFVALPPGPTNTPDASGDRAPVAGVEPQGPAPVELPAPAVPVVGTEVPVMGTAAEIALAGAKLALPVSPISSGAPQARVPAPAPGTALGTEGSSGSGSALEAPAPLEGPPLLGTAIGDGAGAGGSTSDTALPALAADEGGGGSRPSPIHGLAQVPLAEGVGDRAPEALERPSTHAADIERAERVLQQLRLKISPGLRRATLALEPANLGRITIALHVRDGRLEAVLRAEKVETLGVLEAHMPELRAMLEQSGIDAKNIDLELGSESDTPDADPGASDGSGSNAGGTTHDPFDLEDTDTFGASRLAQAITDELGVDIYA